MSSLWILHLLIIFQRYSQAIIALGNPLLRKVSQPVAESEIGSKEIKKLIRDLFDTMENANGLGLAAPQIGVLKRIIVVGFEDNKRYPSSGDKVEHQVLINPELKVLDGPIEGFWEGCLSVPGMRGLVERTQRISLKWYDEHQNHHEEIISGFPAVVFQHEYDHLDGILYVDRLKDTRLFGFSDELDAAEDKHSSARPV